MLVAEAFDHLHILVGMSPLFFVLGGAKLLATTCTSTTSTSFGKLCTSRNFHSTASICPLSSSPSKVQTPVGGVSVTAASISACCCVPFITTSDLSCPAWCGLSTAADIICQLSRSLAQRPRCLITQTRSQLLLVGRQSVLIGNGDCIYIMHIIITESGLSISN